MSRFLRFAGRILLLCLPQLGVSLGTILMYAQALIYPWSAIGMHIALVAALQVLFFGGWSTVALRCRGAERSGCRLLYAVSCVVKGMMFNLVYLLSYATYQLWGTYLSWNNLKAALPHLRGFYLALGPSLFVGLGLAALLLLVHFLFALKTAERSLRWLEDTGTRPTAPAHTLMLASLLSLLAAGLWLRDPHGEKARQMDPILAFWTNQAAAAPVLTADMLADRAAGQAYRPPAEFHRRNVIVIAVDCLRSDHLSLWGYPRETMPFLTAQARTPNAARVDFSVSNGNDSPQGIRTILGSRYPHRHNLHNFRLQDALKRAGYRTHVIGTGDHTTLGEMRQHYGPNIDVFRDGLASKVHSVNDDRGVLEALDGLEPAGKAPAFFYFHLMSAHNIGVREPAFARWQPASLKMEWSGMLLGHANAELDTNNYDNALLQADYFIAEIFRRLEAKGYLGDYVAVVTGDHGQGLGERGNYGHTRFLFAEDIDIPIIFLESGPVNYGPMPFASQVDIAPTLLDRLGLPRPDRWDGKSLYQAPPPEVTYAAGTRDSGWRAVISRDGEGILKYLFYGNKRAAFREHLYDESRDPGEKKDLVNDAARAGLLLELRQMAANEFTRPVPPPD